MTLIIVLAVFTLIFALIEIFLLPGFGWMGLTAIVCAITDVVLIALEGGPWAAGLAIVVAIIALSLLIKWVIRSKRIEKISLQTSIDATNATTDQLSIQPGDTGIACTRLALIGNAVINHKTVEVKSSGSFIEPHTPIRVIHVNQALIIVEKLS